MLRKEAIESGLKSYFTGKACKRGHICARSIRGLCLMCRKENNDKRPKKGRLKASFNKAEYGKKYYETNKEELHKKAKIYRNINRDKRNKNTKEWKIKNKERHSELNRLSRERHLEKTRTRVRDYAKKNPHAIRVCGQNRRARFCKAEGKFTKKDIEKIREKQKNICTICCIDLRHGYHIDHSTPLIRGGTNWPDNIQLLCPDCNRRKHDKTHDEFLEYRKKYYAT